jgi:hypothetical protein
VNVSKLISRCTVAVAMVMTVLLAGAGPASAAQHQNANIYVNWSWTGDGYWNVDQQVAIRQRAASTYWAQLWTWTDAPSYGGYTGLQTNGVRNNGTTGDTAIFSLWNANAASGPMCAYNGEASGYSCTLAYPFTVGTLYRYRVWRLNADSGGQWWGAWIQNTATGVDTSIGAIRVGATHTLMANVRNFAEYFGPPFACNAVPRSVADYTQPAANYQGGGSYQFGSTYASSSRASCTGGGVTTVSYGWTNAARVTLGG